MSTKTIEQISSLTKMCFRTPGYFTESAKDLTGLVRATCSRNDGTAFFGEYAFLRVREKCGNWSLWLSVKERN